MAILTESTVRTIRQIMSSSGLTRRSRNNAFIFTGSPVKRGMTGGVSRGHDISYNRHCEGVNPWQSSLRHCEPDKAWQSIRDCFVALLLAMTGKCGVIANEVWQSIRDCFVALLLAMTGCGDCFVVSRLAMTSRPDVIPDLIGYPENKKSSCADVVRWILGSSPRMTEEKNCPRMTGKSGVIANAVWQSLNRLLRHFIPRNDGVFKNVLAMTGKRGIRLHSDLRAGLCRGSFFPARFVFSGFCHTCLCAGLPLNRMVFFNNVNK